MTNDSSGDNASTDDTATGARSARPTIVVVEDEATIRLVLANKLRGAGWDVVDAANGEDALAAIRARTPDLVLTDLQMPRMDGIAMARALHADPATRSIPIVLLSARGHRVGTGDLAHTNIQHVLLKPFSMRQILALAEEYVDRPRSLAA
jgi:CheY-like chemotaxis protein